LFIILAASWRQASLAGLLLLSGLQTLPRELPEAATIDGAGVVALVRYVMIPWLRPVLGGVVILNAIYAFLQFDVIFAMTQGGPGEATMLLSILMYRELFIFSEFGVGSVLAILLGVLAIVGSLFAATAIGRDDVETR
jgi:multiple sugar transport system permease protein